MNKQKVCNGGWPANLVANDWYTSAKSELSLVYLCLIHDNIYNIYIFSSWNFYGIHDYMSDNSLTQICSAQKCGWNITKYFLDRLFINLPVRHRVTNRGRIIRTDRNICVNTMMILTRHNLFNSAGSQSSILSTN